MDTKDSPLTPAALAGVVLLVLELAVRVGAGAADGGDAEGDEGELALAGLEHGRSSLDRRWCHYRACYFCEDKKKVTLVGRLLNAEVGVMMVLGSTATTHLPHEDPDQPEAACEDREDDVDEEVEGSVLLHCITPCSGSLYTLLFLREERKPLAPVKGPWA